MRLCSFVASVDDILLASWRLAAEELKDAAQATDDRNAKRRLARRVFLLAQKAEQLERWRGNRLRQGGEKWLRLLFLS